QVACRGVGRGIPDPYGPVVACRGDAPATGAECNVEARAGMAAQDKKFLGLVYVPDLHASVVTCRCKPLAVRAEPDPEALRGVSTQRQGFAPSLQVPEFDRAVEAGRNEAAVGCEGKGSNVCPVAEEFKEFAARPRVVDLDGPSIVAGGKPLAVRAE